MLRIVNAMLLFLNVEAKGGWDGHLLSSGPVCVAQHSTAMCLPCRAQQPEEVVEIVLPSAARRAVLLAGASALLAQLPLATPAFAYQQSEWARAATQTVISLVLT